MKKTILALAMIPLWIGDAAAESFTFNSFAGGTPLVIPDNGATQDQETISSSITSIESIVVSLGISGTAQGAFNGDLFIYLQHASDGGPVDTSVLVNRPGKTTDNPSGYPDNGLNIQLSDAAGNTRDIHNYQTVVIPANSTALTGLWQTDARSATPDAVTDASARDAFLSVFNGKDANGTWTLFLGDASAGGVAQLDSWGLQFTGVPEPREWAALSAAALLGFGMWRRAKRGKIEEAV